VDTVDDAIAVADREWRAYGVSHPDRAVLAGDLRLDLQAAAAEGATPEQILGADVRDFARRLADEAGVRRAQPEYGRVVRTAMIGVVLGICVGFIVDAIGHPLLVAWFDLPFRPPIWLAVLLYFGIITLFAVGGAVVAVRTRLADLPGIRQTTNAMILLLPASGAVSVPVIWWSATAVGPLSPVIVAIEVALAAAALIGAILLARTWALRDHRRRRTAVAA
jgi:hypothetical protein